MVVALKPGKFYGSSLPRPRIYTDVTLNEERVDPPLPVLDSLLSWANYAHWSMGGLSFKHHRLQGRIEGRISKLRARQNVERKKLKKMTTMVLPKKTQHDRSLPSTSFGKRLSALSESEEEEETEQRKDGTVASSFVRDGGKRKRARKLSDEFDKVASSPPKAEEDDRKRKMPPKAVENTATSTAKKKAETLSLGKRMSTIASHVRSRSRRSRN